MDIAKALRDALDEKHMTQADLRKQTGMSSAYISMLLNGKIPDPKASNMYKIAHALDMTVDELLERSDVEYYWIEI